MPTQKSKRNKRSRSSPAPTAGTPPATRYQFTTVKQQRYCRRAIGINRFVYNLCVATHRFCRSNRLPFLSIEQDLLQLPDRERETQAGTSLAMQQLQRRTRRNINAAVNLCNLLTLPAGSGVMLRDGKALAVGPTTGETSPSDRRTATPEPLLWQR